MKPLLISLLFSPLFFGSGNPSAQQNTSAKGPIAGKAWGLPLNKTVVLPMSWIPAGTFVMGSPETEAGRKPDESPQTTVTLTKGYWIGNTEVTIGEWNAVTGMNVRDKVNKLLKDTTMYDFMGKKMLIRDFMHFDKNDPDKVLANENDELPMYFVNWNEAMQFCKKLTSQERAAHRLPAGYEYTLPTEAQWEYACRAGSTGATYYGATDTLAWYGGNSFKGYKGKGFGNPVTGSRNVAGKLPNKWGMYDMLGNLWEWCYDWYGPYPGGKVTDPVGPASGIYRVNRGGSFGSGINDERSANRATNPPNEDSAWRGFRIVLSPIK
ncbi:formylglycine-generating enzyme family protein [Mucilaginibacter angelicae]|uniref:Formylglycine-generating enzyme family protein n=1 Tax=Mucilaginibacter angelicae TaxID=869718 RepID=A0ABV6L5J3_9SPHI